MLLALGYLADVWILATYAYLSRTGKDVPFHWANAIGAIPLLVAEVAAGLWPVLVLTLTFCVLGAYGVVRARRLKWRGERDRVASVAARQVADFGGHWTYVNGEWVRS